MSTKFRPYQRVVVRNFVVNGVRMDIGAEVLGYVLDPEDRRLEVRINSVLVVIKEDRLVDYEEYWAELKKKESEEE